MKPRKRVRDEGDERDQTRRRRGGGSKTTVEEEEGEHLVIRMT
jgi:hypothetical protein